jgi:hypoxanthine phosphoribosyltransferase
MSFQLEENIEEVLVSKEALASRIAELGAQITRDYAGQELLMAGILKGAIMFMVDLAREVQLPLTIDFMAISSYGASTKSSGVVRIIKDLDESVDGKHILVVEDIIDTGLTLKYILRNLSARRPASVKVCGLLVKEKGRPINIDVDYVGFNIPDRFVVGYGLDFAEVYRNLPYVGVLKPQCYAPPSVTDQDD